MLSQRRWGVMGRDKVIKGLEKEGWGERRLNREEV